MIIIHTTFANADGNRWGRLSRIDTRWAIELWDFPKTYERFKEYDSQAKAMEGLRLWCNEGVKPECPNSNTGTSPSPTKNGSLSA